MMDIGVYNLDDGLIDATRADGLPRLKIYRPDFTAIVLGRGSKPATEIFSEEAERDKIAVLRRHGGGCAVVLDPGNVILSLTLPGTGFRKVNEHFATITSWLIDGLSRAGVRDVRREGISDLAVGDMKIGGACMQMKRDYVYYSVSLLYDPEIVLMEKYLRHPPHEPAYRRKRAHRDFVGSIRLMAGRAGEAGIQNFMETLGDQLDISKPG
jgi:lipoate-protein ligase A